MGSLHILTPVTDLDFEEIRGLLREYGTMRGHDEALGDYHQELTDLPGVYAAPRGALLLARWSQQPVGCVAFRHLEAGICEMKRMFVLPDYQGNGIGLALAKAIIKEARSAGMNVMRLDTHPGMVRAQALYLKLGFREIGRYNANPTPGIRFFEKRLDDSDQTPT